VSGYDDVIRDRAMAIVRARSKPIDRSVLLVAVRRGLNVPLTKDDFSRIMQGYLSAEKRVDQRGRVIGTWLDLPERVELRKAFRAARNARED
jgi:hypothetical protein